jgi:hypothetical protein
MRSPILKFILVFAIVFLAYFFYRRHVVAPTPSTPATTTQTGTSEQLPESFKAFYEQFQSDSTYQVNHIIWPLRRITDDSIPLPDWTAETWVLHQPFNDMGGTFERSFIVSDQLIQEVIADASGNYSMERRYHTAGDSWRMIYYRAMGAYGQQ